MKYFICCGICNAKITTRKALSKHYLSRHRGRNFPSEVQVVDESGKQIETPAPKELPSKVHRGYLAWLTSVVEGINSAHNPSAPTKWYHLTLTNVPLEYFEHLLFKIEKAELNSVKEARHVRPPIWKKTALKISYRCYGEDDVFSALEEQSLPISEEKAFKGDEEVPTNYTSLTGRGALEAAKRKQINTPSTRTVIKIGEGEGRATREFELLWWPLYTHSTCGVLTLRMYFAEVTV